MSAPKTSFGYRLVIADRPDLRFDLEELPLVVRYLGSLDEVARELEIQGSGNATAIRTNALRAFGERFVVSKETMQAFTVRLFRVDRDMAAWCASSCCRHMLATFGLNASRAEAMTQALDTLDGYLRGEVARADLEPIAVRLLTDPKLRINCIDEAVRYALVVPQNHGRYSACRSISSVAIALERFSDGDGQGVDARLRGLRSVIADALPGMPVRMR